MELRVLFSIAPSPLKKLDYLHATNSSIFESQVEIIYQELLFGSFLRPNLDYWYQNSVIDLLVPIINVQKISCLKLDLLVGQKLNFITVGVLVSIVKLILKW